jgi:hypothetical protein
MRLTISEGPVSAGVGGTLVQRLEVCRARNGCGGSLWGQDVPLLEGSKGCLCSESHGAQIVPPVLVPNGRIRAM